MNGRPAAVNIGDGRAGYLLDWLFASILLREAETLIENAPTNAH